jgi:hypothetical protein
MNEDFPSFEAKPGTVIRVFATPQNASSFCGYCRGLILERDHFRLIGGFRRYTDCFRKISWAEPVEWPAIHHSLIWIYFAPERPWMKLSAPPAPHSET